MDMNYGEWITFYWEGKYLIRKESSLLSDKVSR